MIGLRIQPSALLASKGSSMNLWVESTVQDSTHVLAQVRAHLDEFVATAKFGAYEFLTARQVVHGERKTGSKPAINLTKFRASDHVSRRCTTGANPELCAAGNSPIRHVALLLSHRPTTNHQTSRHSSTRRYAEEQRFLVTHQSGTCAVLDSSTADSSLPRSTSS